MARFRPCAKSGRASEFMRSAGGDLMLRPAFLAAALTMAFVTTAPGLFPSPAMAFDAPKESRLDSSLYKPSAELVRSLLDDEHINSKIDQDGDLEVTFHGHDVAMEGWVVFDKIDNGGIWNLRFTAPVPSSETRDIDRDDLLRFANNWNRDEIAVKLFVDDDGTLQSEHDLPVQFGVNPQEFLENGVRLYQNALGRIVDALAEARGSGDSGTDNSNNGGNAPDQQPYNGGSSGGSNAQPQKSIAPPDEGEGI
jgi:hypothetical protein